MLLCRRTANLFSIRSNCYRVCGPLRCLSTVCDSEPSATNDAKPSSLRKSAIQGMMNEAQTPADDNVSFDGVQLKPKEIVAALDRHIVGQMEAKRAVAIALRNRWRRSQLPAPIKDEITPKNILMVGPTGVGKTEIARRLAKLANAPFVKVEATKYTEVGFHGRDVDTIIRDLVETAIVMVRLQLREKAKQKLRNSVEDRILDILMGQGTTSARDSFRGLLREGALDHRFIEIEIPQNYPLENDHLDVTGTYRHMNTPPEQRKQYMRIKDCWNTLEQLQFDQMFPQNRIAQFAISAAEENGIVFIDEVDKLVGNKGATVSSPDASAEGVQRDLLPLIEGCSVSTKHGLLRTDHILFIASGAFQNCKPADLLAELQGRLPIRVELMHLSVEDLYRILKEPESNLIVQQIALLSTEGVALSFQDDALVEIAKVAAEVNMTVENIGARRLITVIERIMDKFSFEASDLQEKNVVIDAAYVKECVSDLLQRKDLLKFVL